MNTSIQTRVPRGCDQQGRHPQAAEAATEVGADEPATSTDCAWVYGVPIAVLLIIGAVSAALWPY